METTPNSAKLYSALSRAQAKISPPHFNREVTAKTSKGNTYTCQYATLDKIIESVHQSFAENGLSISQTLEVENSQHRLVTRLHHESDQQIESVTPPISVEDNTIQGWGHSTIADLQRLQLASLLGFADTNDDLIFESVSDDDPIVSLYEREIFQNEE